MYKTRPIMITVAYLILAMFSVCLAKAEKLELRDAAGEVQGHAVVNYIRGEDKTMVQVNCQNLEAETEYAVYLDQTNVGMFTTEPNGTGSFHVKLDGDHSEARPVTVQDSENKVILTSAE